MRNLILLFITFSAAFVHSQDYFKGDAPYRPELHLWKERVIVLRYTEQGQALLEEQLQILREKPQGLRERNLVVYLSNDQSLDHPWPFTFLLHGKDGGVKLRKHKPVKTELLFSTIDAMPMRKREMRQE